MFARKYWNVLIVDDEPDIHDLTELVLKKEVVFGAKLKLHHANSKREALELLQKDQRLLFTLSVALVDVVMETDQAGLELCKVIREDWGRQSTSLILRTGQPGHAPPRKIIDDYNITTYLTKLEASGDRLYMAVKAAIQSYYNLAITQNRNQMLDVIRAKASSPKELLEAFQSEIQKLKPSDDLAFHVAHDFFGKYYAGAGVFAERAAYDAIKDDLLARARPQLEQPLAGVPSLLAKVDEYSVVQTKVIGTDKVATMVLKDAVYPRDMLWFYGSMWRQSLAYLAELLARA